VSVSAISAHQLCLRLNSVLQLRVWRCLCVRVSFLTRYAVARIVEAGAVRLVAAAPGGPEGCTGDVPEDILPTVLVMAAKHFQTRVFMSLAMLVELNTALDGTVHACAPPLLSTVCAWVRRPLLALVSPLPPVSA
jgi:hypothetical protein